MLANAWLASAQERRNSAPEFLHASYDFSIAENAAVGAAVGTVAASDSDDDALTYTITAGNGDGKFAIDGSTGNVTVAAALDHETTSSYALTVQADDGYGGTASATANITVTACTASGDAPAPTAVTVDGVPIVVTSTTDDYFVLYVSHETNAGTTIEWPVAVTLGEAGTTTLSENVEVLPAARYRVEKYRVAEPADVDGDCIDDITELRDPATSNPVNPTPAIAINDGVGVVRDWSTFKKISLDNPGSDGRVGPEGTRVTKFTFSEMGTDLPGLYFINVNTHRIHNEFLDVAGDDFDDGDELDGDIIFIPSSADSINGQGTYYWALETFQYTDSVELFEVYSRAYTMLAASMPLLNDNLVLWIPTQDVQYLQNLVSSLSETRITFAFDDEVWGDKGFFTLNPGVGYGRLRQLDADEQPHPRDIVLYEALPNELPPVAGIISTVPQTPLSHVNLRAVQNGVPNVYVRDVLDDTDISDLIGDYVRLEATGTDYSVHAATPAEVEAHYAFSRPFFTQVPRRDLSVTGITPLQSIGFDDWDAFGVKAANLAVLRTLGFPEGTVPDGFAIPFYFYDEFMKANNLYDDVRTMLADEDFRTDYDVQEKELKKLRKKIKKSDTPQWIIDALETMHATFPAGQSLRYRSSTNNEDLPGFNGAGLYDSKTQKPGETVEDGIDKSLKQVYASLWNFRAFSEREFHHVDHLGSAMGVLVHPNYSEEQVNGVAVSFDPLRGDNNRYYVNSQLGEDLITNPEAYSVPEELLLDLDDSRGPPIQNTYEVLGLSNLVEPGRLLMTNDQIDQLRQHLGTIHNRFKRLYNPSAGESFAMEIEFKITSEDILAIKQARPWVFPRTIEGTPPRATTTDQSVHLRWELPVTGYIDDMYLERLDKEGQVEWSTTVESDIDSDEATTWEDSDRFLVAGTTYRYRVKLDTQDYGVIYSDMWEVATQSEPPAPPTGLSATATHDTVSLSWTVPEQPEWVTGPVSLRVMRQRSGRAVEVGTVDWQKGVTGYSFTDAVPWAAQTYRYFIRMVAGARLHDSEQVSVTTETQPDDSDGTREGATVLDAEAAVGRSYFTNLFRNSLNRDGGDRVDYYVFTTTDRHRLIFGAWREYPEGHDRIHRGVTLEDPEGNTTVESSPPPGDSARETLETAIEPGTYYVRVEAIEDGPYAYFILFGLTEAPLTSAPVFDSTTYGFSIAEDANTGAAVGVISATDAEEDTLTYTIEAGNGDGKFAIDGGTGAITTAGALDYETTSAYTLTVEADDDNGGTATATVNVTVTDEDEAVGPLTGFALLDASTQTVLATLTEGTVVELADPDAGNYGIRAEIAAGESVGSVRLELSGAKTVSRTENVTPYSLYGDGGEDSLHGEALRAGSYLMRATAYPERNLGGEQLAAIQISFTVTVPNRPPEFDAASYDFSIAADTAVGDAVGAVPATDKDGDGLNYNITAGNEDGKFAIEVSSGAISVAGALDYETDASYVLAVQADDGNGGRATATVNITVTDVVESSPGPLTGFILVDASDHSVLATLTNGSSVELFDPDGGSYAIRADVDPDATIGSVKLELSGAKTVTKTENIVPYSLYGDSGTEALNGEALPAGSYTLRATAYSEKARGGDVLGVIEVSFTVTAQ